MIPPAVHMLLLLFGRALFVTVNCEIPTSLRTYIGLRIYIAPAGTDSKMQVRTGGIAGRSLLRNGLSLFHRLAFRCQDLGTVHIYGVYTAAMTDHDVISRRIAVGKISQPCGCCCRDGPLR